MASFFLDSSATAKLYMREQGSVWVTHLVDPSQRHELFAIRIGAAEVAAALFRRVRSGQLPRHEAICGLAARRRDWTHVFHVVEVQPVVVDLALEMAERYGLRGYDCIQLAGALLTQRARVAARMDSLTLVSADEELNSAANAEGMAVENPNHYP